MRQERAILLPSWDICPSWRPNSPACSHRTDSSLATWKLWCRLDQQATWYFGYRLGGMLLSSHIRCLWWPYKQYLHCWSLIDRCRKHVWHQLSKKGEWGNQFRCREPWQFCPRRGRSTALWLGCNVSRQYDPSRCLRGLPIVALLVVSP